MQPWEWFILAAHHHLLDPEAGRELAIGYRVLCGATMQEADAQLADECAAWADRLPPPECWPGALDALKSRPVSIEGLMLDFVVRQVASAPDEDAAQAMLPRCIESAAFAAAVVQGLHGPASRWPARKLLSPATAQVALSVHQWRGLPLKHAAEQVGVPLSTAYRLLAKKTGS